MIQPDVPLSDPDLERRLLGLLMLLSEGDHTAATRRALSIVRARDFFRPEHRVIYTAMIALDRKNLHFGLDAVLTLLDQRGKTNGVLNRAELRAIRQEGGYVQPPNPEEPATQIRQLGEYRDILRALRQVTEFTGTVTDPPRVRARLRELLTTLERDALVQDVSGQDVNDLLATEFAPLIPVVDKLVFAGTSTLIVGGSKAGKSFLLLGLALAVATGEFALGTLVTDQARPVLYLNLDDGMRRVQIRAKDMLLSMPTPTRGMLQIHAHWPTLDRGGEGMLLNWCERHPDGVVIIDLLENIRPERGGSIYSSDYHALRPLSDMAHSTGATFLIAHHTNKRGLSASEEFDPIAAISGSMGLPGAVDGMLVFRPAKAEEDGARINLIHRDAPRGEYQLSRDELINGWRFDGESIQAKVTSRLSPERQSVLQTIQEANRPLTPIEIATRLRWNPNATRVLLFKMKGAGQIVAYEDGTYQHPGEHARNGRPGEAMSPDSPNR